MTYLLDTHVWLWLEATPERVPESLQRDLRDAATVVYISSVSALEVALKFSIGKLRLPVHPSTYVDTRIRRNGFTPLPVTIAHAVEIANLPLHHKDPFDRLLVAQARVEGLKLVSADPLMAPYDVDLLRI